MENFLRIGVVLNRAFGTIPMVSLFEVSMSGVGKQVDANFKGKISG